MIDILLIIIFISLLLNVYFIHIILKQDQQLLRTQKLLKYLESIIKK